MKINSFLYCSIFAFVVFSQSIFADTLRLSSPVPEGHIFHKVSEKFADELRIRTNGELDVEIFPAGELGGDSENAIMLETGVIHFSVIPIAFMTNQEEAFNAWFLPGLFNNVEEAGRATKLPAAQQMLSSLENQGVVGVGYVFAGMRSLLSVEPIDSIDDIKDQKVAVYTIPMFTDWWLSFGAVPTAVIMPEVPAALAQNVVDVIDLDLDLVMALQLQKQASNLTITNHMGFPAFMVASKKWWDSLTVANRKSINEAFSEAEKWGLQEQLAADERNISYLESVGVSINKIDNSQYKENADMVIDKYTNKNKTISDFYNQVNAQKN